MVWIRTDRLKMELDAGIPSFPSLCKHIHKYTQFKEMVLSRLSIEGGVRFTSSDQADALGVRKIK